MDQKGGKIKNHFIKFDKNHDGTINHQEFRQGLAEGLGMPLRTPEMDLLVRHVDRNGSGIIDYVEFADQMKQPDEYQYRSLGDRSEQAFRIEGAGTEPTGELTEEQRLDRSIDSKLHSAVQSKSAALVDEFRKFDVDGDSMLSRSELRRGLQRVGLEMSQPVWAAWSQGNDRWLQEFKRLVQRMDKDNTGFVDYSEFVRHVQAPDGADPDELRGSAIHNQVTLHA